MTMTLISTVTVDAAGSGTVNFASIPSGFTDLLLVCSTRTNYANNYVYGAIRFNNDSANNYTIRDLRGNESGVNSATQATSFGYVMHSPGTSATASTFGSTSIYIPNYAGATAKSWSQDSVSENNSIYAERGINAGIWTGTAAINSISLFPGGGYNFVQYSTFSLYGITKGSGGATVS